MKDTVVRIVCGLLGLAATAIAISFALEAIRTRDGAWYVGSPLSVISAFAALMLLKRALRGAVERQKGQPQ